MHGHPTDTAMGQFQSKFNEGHTLGSDSTDWPVKLLEQHGQGHSKASLFGSSATPIESPTTVNHSFNHLRLA